MIKKIAIAAVSAMMMLAMPAKANVDAFATCMVDSLNGKERKQLAQWVYFAIAAHPEMAPFAKVTDKDRDVSDKVMGDLVNRLLIEDCSEELVVAFNQNPLAVNQAFEFVGKVAMQELMTNPEVMATISNYAEHLDQEKLNGLLSGK
ncbi:hypothetical protein D515_00888 [Grimontia indica]|uniref:DUF2059 domain-containing protein n=1 Tax=Grimontia indica TaxID=1056512 RepID=R1GVM0_9GAMM|nr:hypothetical protein [Grimontia indica]EOD80064.1 hypothetical protein D515_00888 [Grimontia indica]